MFYQRERVSRYTLVTNAPFAVTAGNYSRPLGGATPAALTGAAASPSGGYDTSNTVPMSMQWNLTVEQSLARNTVLQVSYVGNRREHLTSVRDVNAIQSQTGRRQHFAPTGSMNSFRPYSNFGALAYWTHQGDAYYNGLQTLFRTQISHFRASGGLYLVACYLADIDNDGWFDLLSVNGHVYPQVDSLPSGARYREPSNLF